MVSIDCVERGLARYIDTEILPNLPKDGVKGVGIGIAASLLVKRGGVILREYIKNPMLQQLGIVSVDGSVDLDVLREAAMENISAQGVVVDLPLGVTLRINADDVDSIYKAIREEARL